MNPKIRKVLYGPPNWIVSKFSSEDRLMIAFWIVVLSIIGALFFGTRVLYVTILSIVALTALIAGETPVREEKE